ncbi:MAG: hypothetical protein K2X82_21025 [Gemmataceae bacterium]|nr:hypothetical protein [Gemmataceae bacterium]
MRTARRVAVVLLVLGGAAAAGVYGLRQLPASISYQVTAEFDALPPTDEPLEEWLRAQPGVVKAFANRRGQTVEVIWIMTQSAGPRLPPTPDVAVEFERLGYRGRRSVRYG